MEKEILYQFIGMELVQFATFENYYVENDEEIEITNKFQFSYNFDENIMCCTSSVTLSKESRIFLKADLASYFGIEPGSAESLKDSVDLIAPAELLAQFASLTYGAIRGVIFCKDNGHGTQQHHSSSKRCEKPLRHLPTLQEDLEPVSNFPLKSFHQLLLSLFPAFFSVFFRHHSPLCSSKIQKQPSKECRAKFKQALNIRLLPERFLILHPDD